MSMQGLHAITFTWDGGGADNKLTTIANWNPDATVTPNGNGFLFGEVVPGGQTSMDINAGGNIVDFNFSALAPAMTITASANSMQIAAGGSLTPITNNSLNLQTFNSNVKQFWIGGASSGTHPNLIKNRTWNAAAGDLSYGPIFFRPDSINVNNTTGIVSTANLVFAGNFNHTANNTVNLEGSWTGKTANLIKNGTGTLLLKGSGTYNGTTTINEGVIRIQNGNSLGTGVVTEVERTDIKTGAALEVDGSLTSTEFIRVAGTGISSAGAIHAISGTSSLNSQIAMEGTGGALVSFGVNSGATLKVGRLYSDLGRETLFEKVGEGTLVLKGNESDDYVGSTTVSGGTLQVGDAGLTGELKLSEVINNSNISFNRSNTYDYAGSISGTGSLTQAGIGMTILSGAHLYSGPTNVSAGVLAVSGSLDAASTVNVTGGTLGGEGMIGGNVNIVGNLQADDQTSGALTIGGNLTATGPVAVNLSSPAPTPGTYLIATFGSVTNPGNFGTSYRGGSVSFTATTMSLTVGSSAALSLNWSGAASNVWDAGNSANWVNPAPQAFFTGDSVTFSDGAANTNLEVSGDIRPATTIVNAATTPYTFGGSGSINGTGGLDKSGAGTLTITTANGYSGGTTITEGQVRIGSDLALGSGNISLSNAGLSSVGTTSHTLVNPLAIGGDLVLGNATDSGALFLTASEVSATAGMNLTVASDVTISGVISDGSSGYGLTKLGSGKLTLSGANTFSGPVSLSAGRVRVGNNNALGAGSASLTFDGGTLSSDGLVARTVSNSPVVLPASISLGDSVDRGDITLSGTLDLSADTTISSQSPVIFSGALSGSAALTKSGSSTLFFTGDSSFTGAVSVNAGTLKFQKLTTTTSEIGAGSSITVANGATAQLQTPNNHTASVAAAISLDGNGVANTLEFPGGNTGVYNLAGDITLSNAPVIRYFGLVNTYNYNGVMSGSTNASGLLIKTEGGNSLGQPHNHSINQPATYTGNTTLNAVSQQGVIRLGVADALPTGTILNLIGGSNVNTTASLNLNGFNQTLAGITSTSNPGRTNVSNTSATLATLTIANDTDVIMSGILGRIATPATGGNNFALTKTGTGTFTISGANTYTGETKVLAGTLAVTGSSIADNGTVIIDGGVVNVTGNETISHLFFGTEEQAFGTWGGLESSATYKDERFTGTGTLTILSPFGLWANAFTGPALTDKTAVGDPDGDGLSNAIEYVLGTDPRVSSQSARPTSTDDGSNITFKFKRVDSSETPDVAVFVQTSADLVIWDDTYPVGTESSTGVDIQEMDVEADEITVTIPHLELDERFVRLKVTAP
jgi:fibronectin-binding autotransporter adhesin